MWTVEDLKRAAEEDRVFQRLLDDANNRRLARCHAGINRYRTRSSGGGPKRAAKTLARSIANKDLLSADELRTVLGATQPAIDEAVASNRLFAF